MKLRRLAGYGPAAAFVSAGGLVVFAIFQFVPIPANLFNALVPVYFLSMFVLAGALTITLLDLQWMDHPAASTGWVKSALAAAIVATAMAPIALAAQLTKIAYPYADELPAALFLLGVGYSIVVHMIQARRHELLHRVLPWLGIVTGASFIYLGILQFIFMFTPVLLMGFVYAFQPALLLYFIWAIWMGVHLVRSKAPARATAPVPAAS